MFGMQTAELAPLATPDLVSLADLKVYACLPGNADDAVLSGLISAASQAVENYCDRALGARVVTETMLPEDPLNTLALTHCPVSALTSLTIGGAVQDLADYNISLSTGLLRRKDGAPLNAPGQEVVAVYAAGYSVAPTDLASAVKKYVTALHHAREQDPALKSESVPDVGRVEYLNPGDALVSGPSGASVPASVAGLLGPYVRWYSF